MAIKRESTGRSVTRRLVGVNDFSQAGAPRKSTGTSITTIMKTHTKLSTACGQMAIRRDPIRSVDPIRRERLHIGEVGCGRRCPREGEEGRAREEEEDEAKGG